LQEVLRVNKDILARGYSVLYDSHPDLLESQIRALMGPADDATPGIPNEAALNNDLNELLFYIVWALKKIKRGELWVAVTCINAHISAVLLRLIDAHNSRQSMLISYEGRFLEARTDPAIVDRFKTSFTRYDAQDAIRTLGCLVDTVRFISRDNFEANGYPFNPVQFDRIKQLMDEVLQAN
jgi:aminoglycoside 6-adenylyltransferase